MSDQAPPWIVPNYDERIAPEGERCGVVHRPTKSVCMASNGHKGTHRNLQGTWNDGPWCDYPAAAIAPVVQPENAEAGLVRWELGVLIRQMRSQFEWIKREAYGDNQAMRIIKACDVALDALAAVSDPQEPRGMCVCGKQMEWRGDRAYPVVAADCPVHGGGAS